jgi:hypothetical protein
MELIMNVLRLGRVGLESLEPAKGSALRGDEAYEELTWL